MFVQKKLTCQTIKIHLGRYGIPEILDCDFRTFSFGGRRDPVRTVTWLWS